MSKLSGVRALAVDLFLTESTVGSPAKVQAMADLKRASVALDSSDADLAMWLSYEHYAGGVYLTAASMNKKAELSGKGNAFDALTRGELIARYNRWAAQFVERIDQVDAGTADLARFLTRLENFRNDPIHAEP